MRPTQGNQDGHHSEDAVPDRCRSTVSDIVSPDRMEPSEAGDEYLAPADVARLLCVSARTVSRWADQGRIPHLVTLGGHRRFLRSDIVRLLDQRGRAQD